jgi:Conserved oligomeric complex COG6
VSTILTLLDTEAASWEDVLTAGEVAFVFRKCELDSIIALLKEVKPGNALAILHTCDDLIALLVDVPASSMTGLEQYRITAVLTAFYSALFSQLSPKLDRLQDPALREKIQRILADTICEDYSLVICLDSPSNALLI